MKTALIFLLLLLPLQLLFGQMPQRHTYKQLKDLTPLGVGNEQVYLLKAGRKQWDLQVYSSDSFALKAVVPIDFRSGGRVRELEAAFILNGHPVVVTSYAAMARNVRVVELFRVIDGHVQMPVTIAELSMKSLFGDPAASRSLAVEWMVSPDEKSVAFSLQDQQQMTEAANREVIVLDSACRVVMRQPVRVHYPVNVATTEFDVTDQVHLLNGGLLVHKTIMNTTLYTGTKAIKCELPELSDNYKVCRLPNGNVAICGLSNNKESGFLLYVTGKEFNRTMSFQFDFPGAYRCRLRQLQPDGNDGLIVVAEELLYSTSTYAMPPRTVKGTTRVRAYGVRGYVREGKTRIAYLDHGAVRWLRELESVGQLSKNEQGFRVSVVEGTTRVFGNLITGDVARASVVEWTPAGTETVRALFTEPGTTLYPQYSQALNSGFLIVTQSFFTYLPD